MALEAPVMMPPVRASEVEAVSVVKVPAAGVVEPIADGAAKFTLALSRTPEVTSAAAWVWVSTERSTQPVLAPVVFTKVNDCRDALSVASVTKGGVPPDLRIVKTLGTKNEETNVITSPI